MRELPMFRWYTVDLKLSEFRLACPNCREVKFIPFESSQGDELVMQIFRFYKAGGTLFVTEYSNEGIKLIPVPLEEIELAVMRVN